MYLEHFGLRQQPFGATPDPTFLYFSRQHTEALAALHYGLLERRGLLVLIGGAGTGKTSLLHHLLRLWRDRADTAFVFHPPETREQILGSLLEDLGFPNPDTYREAVRLLYNRAVECRRKGRRLILVVDEAQYLSPALLEQIRLLSNFESPDQKLAEIILAGQPGLERRLQSPECEQVRQRVAIAARIGKLEPDEVAHYVAHRLRLAGREGKLFTRGAQALLAEASGGVPRTINAICFEALSAACAQGEKRIDEREIRRAALALCARDAALVAPMRPARTRRALRWVAGAAGALLGMAAAQGYVYWRSNELPVARAAASAIPMATKTPPPGASPARSSATAPCVSERAAAGKAP